MAVTEYLWDSVTDSIVEEYNGAGQLQVQYTQTPERYGPLISQCGPNGCTTYYHFDGQGSTRRLSDENEFLSEPLNYTAFGELLTPAPHLPPFLYIGELGYYFDSEIGYTYVRARSYAAWLGRWLSQDPAGFVDGLNLLAYVGNNPVNLGDPSGRLAVSLVSANTNVACGKDYRVNWRFRLAAKAPCHGYFVQHIRYQHCYRTCDVCCDDESCNLSVPNDKGQFTGEYWEAFPLRNPETHPFESELASRDGIIDAFRNRLRNKACGYSVVEAIVKFYCRDANAGKGIVGTGNLEAILGGVNPTWGAPHPQAGVSGISSQTRPDFWKERPIDGPASRRFAIAWRCCELLNDDGVVGVQFAFE